MIKTEIITINGTNYQRTYSDIGFMVERDGARYEEAIDPIGSGRVYAETALLSEADAEAVEDVQDAE